MANTITLSEAEWGKIYNTLARECPPSYLLIRDVMRRELGFTVRRHSEYEFHKNTESYYLREKICLDFYDDAQETWFRLRFLNT